MNQEAIIESIKKDRNLYRAYITGKNLVKRSRELETVPPLLDHSIFLTRLLLMRCMDLKVEEVDALLSPAESPKIHITSDVNAAFIELRNDYDSSKQMANALGLSEGVVSMYISRKRKLTIDKMIDYLNRIKRKYIIDC